MLTNYSLQNEEPHQATASGKNDRLADRLRMLFSLTNLLKIKKPFDDRLKKNGLFNGKKYSLGDVKNSIQSYLYEVLREKEGSTSINLYLCGGDVNFSEDTFSKLLEACESAVLQVVEEHRCHGDDACAICWNKEEIKKIGNSKSGLLLPTQEGVSSIPDSCDSITDGKNSCVD